MRTHCLPLLLLTGCADCRHSPDEAAAPSAMILVLDGVRSEEFTSDTRVSDLTGMTGQAYAAQTWAALGAEAATLPAALNPGVTITASGHAQMVTGRIDPYANFSEPAGPGLYRPEYTTIFEEARAQLGLPADSAVFIGNTELLQGAVRSIQPGSADVAGTYQLLYDPDKPNAPINNDDPMVDAIEAAVAASHPRLLVANFHDVDRAGHYGTGDAYIDDVKKLDGLLPALWSWLGDNEPAYRDNLLVFIVADHGRHRHDEDEGWRNHGDACTGCREIPLMVLGPGAPAGTGLAGEWTLLDLAPTVAAHVGFDAPWAQGLPIDEVVDGGSARTGDVGLTADGAAWTRWRDDDAARDEVVLDGEAVSTPGAMFAEGVHAWTGAVARIACWRELTLLLGDAEWPWTGACRVDRGDGWVDAPAPEATVGTNWAPAFAEQGGTLWALYNHNPDGIGELGVREDVGVRLRAWRADGSWGDAASSTAYFPTDPALAATASGLVAAFGTNDGGDSARDTRHVRVLTARLTGEAAAFDPDAVDVDLRGVLDGARVERPALTADGDTVRLAVLATTDTDNVVAVLVSTDGGHSFGEPALVSSDPALPHLSPQWRGDTLVWAARAADGQAELCEAAPDQAPTCTPTGSTRLDSFSARAGTAVIDAGSADWQRITLAR